MCGGQKEKGAKDARFDAREDGRGGLHLHDTTGYPESVGW